MLFLFILSFTVAVTLGSGTYDVDDAWRQMNAMTDHTATFSSTISEEVIKPKNKPQLSAIQLRSTDHMQAAASSYGGGGYGGGGYGGGGYGGGGHGGGGYGGGGYGGHGGGYGGGHYGSNGSNAVALLGLLLLINLLRDIINQITTTAAGRKKRMVGDSFQDWMSSLSGGGIQSLNYEIAATILPLVSDFTDHADQNKPLVCVQRSLCSANRRLTSNYGQIGKVFAKLSSEAVLDHFRLTHPEGAFKEAATHGRNLSDCYTIYNECKLE